MSLSVGFRRTAAMSLFAQGAHTALVPEPALKTRAEDELDGYADEMDTGLKPLRPGKNVLKALQLDGQFVCATDGSLPATPDPQDFGFAELHRDTRQLLFDFYRTHTGMCPPGQSTHPALPTLRRVVDGILTKHRITYKGRCSSIERLPNFSLDRNDPHQNTVTQNALLLAPQKHCQSMDPPPDLSLDRNDPHQNTVTQNALLLAPQKRCASMGLPLNFSLDRNDPHQNTVTQNSLLLAPQRRCQSMDPPPDLSLDRNDTSDSS